MNYAAMWLLLALFTTQLWAADPISSAIEQAQGLALKKDRQAAARVLSQAMQDTRPPLKGRSRLIEALGNIAKVFFTDKGQKLYELGQSTMFENPDGALGQFREALALEDGNILVLGSIARIQLAKVDCGGAALTVQKAREIDPYASDPAVLELRTLICQKNFEDFRIKVKLLPTLDKGQDPFVQYLVAQDLLQQKMWRKATDILLKVSEDEPQFPESYYWLTKAGIEAGRDTDPWAEKYVSLCKGLSSKVRKRYSLEPRLCVNAKEVEDELAKKNADL